MKDSSAARDMGLGLKKSRLGDNPPAHGTSQRGCDRGRLARIDVGVGEVSVRVSKQGVRRATVGCQCSEFQLMKWQTRQKNTFLMLANEAKEYFCCWQTN